MPKTPLKLIHIATRHQVFLEGHKTHLHNEFQPFLQKIARVIDKRLSGDITDYNRERFEKLLKHTRDDIRDVYSKHYGVWREQIMDFADYEAGFEVRSLKQVVKNHDFALPSRSQLKAAVFSTPMTELTGIDQSSLLPSFYRDWTERTIKRVDNTIKAGYYTGRTTPQIVRQIKGTRGLRFRDGQLHTANKDIMMLTRTSLQHTAVQARKETWKNNRDIIIGRRIIATLDDRTTEICQVYDQEVFPLDTGPSPPFHIGCRTSEVPVMDERFDFLDEDEQRAARGPDGKVYYVDGKMSYFEWLKTEHVDFQKAAIGNVRADLLRDGKISAKKFTELGLNKTTHKPLNLKEMYKLEPTVFKNAGYTLNDNGNVVKK